MIGQVIGKDGKPNAVIQLINKLDETGHIAEITPEALKRFQDMQKLIGMCIDNTSQIEGSIGMAIKLNDIMVKVKGLMDLEDSDKNVKNLNEMHDSI